MCTGSKIYRDLMYEHEQGGTVTGKRVAPDPNERSSLYCIVDSVFRR